MQYFNIILLLFVYLFIFNINSIGYGVHMERSKREITYKSTPEEIVADLCIRTDFIPAPNKTNALTVFFAMLVIHDFFRSATGRGGTDGSEEKDYVNLHSSYLDMQPLYGYNKEISDSIRTFEKGKLKPDAIADDRLNRIPVTRHLIVLFNREHNYVCDQLEREYPGRFPTDEDMYQQARLIVAATWVNCIKREYTCAVAGVYPEGGEVGAFLDAVSGPRHFDASGFHCTMEFNLLYRFHSTIPDWFVPGKSIQRDLETDLHEAITTPSGSFGPFNTPAYMARPEAKAIQMCRDKKLLGFNDFRRSLGLDPYKEFADFNPDPKVIAILEKHYNTPDEVEISAGLHVEPSAKSGWGLGDTLGFAILADATGCASNDRFYTTDYTATLYTEWGIKHTRDTVTADLINRHTAIRIPRAAVLTVMQPKNFLELVDQRPEFMVPVNKSISRSKSMRRSDTATSADTSSEAYAIPKHYREIKPFAEGIDPEFREMVDFATFIFSMKAAKNKGKPTHTTGASAMGSFTVADASILDIPSHKMFVPGATTPIVFRHANAKGFPDDAVADVSLLKSSSSCSSSRSCINSCCISSCSSSSCWISSCSINSCCSSSSTSSSII
jgi:hypothetical protein